MEYTISLASVIGLAVIMLMGVLLSLGLFAVIRMRSRPKAKASPFFVGMLMAFTSGFMLLQIVHMISLSGTVGDVIVGNKWLYALYMGLSTALVEETCRLWTYRATMKKRTDNDYNALMFGAGQGGAEALWMLTLSMAANYLVAVTIYQGHSEYFFQDLTAEETEKTIEILNQLTQKPAIEIFMMGVERIGYSLMHISLAVIVFFSANKKYMVMKPYVIALVTRFVFQFVATLLSQTNIHCVAFALVVCACGAGCAVVAWKVWKREHVPMPEPEPEPEYEYEEEEEPEYEEEEEEEDY